MENSVIAIPAIIPMKVKYRGWHHQQYRKLINLNGLSTAQSIIYPLEAMRPLLFTGLYDRDLKEIYDGDIIQSTWTDERFLVEFVASQGCWRHADGCTTTDGYYRGAIVIGNIFESPDLLTAQDG